MITKKDRVAMSRFVAINEATQQNLSMKRMMHLCFDASKEEFDRALENIKKKAKKQVQ